MVSEQGTIDAGISWDILCGRGGNLAKNPGNKRYRERVLECQQAYLLANPSGKRELAAAIVSQMLGEGRRFLRKEKKDGQWRDIGRYKAEDKTRQALREGLKIRQKRRLCKNEANEKETKKKRKADEADSHFVARIEATVRKQLSLFEAQKLRRRSVLEELMGRRSYPSMVDCSKCIHALRNKGDGNAPSLPSMESPPVPSCGKTNAYNHHPPTNPVLDGVERILPFENMSTDGPHAPKEDDSNKKILPCVSADTQAVPQDVQRLQGEDLLSSDCFQWLEDSFANIPEGAGDGDERSNHRHDCLTPLLPSGINHFVWTQSLERDLVSGDSVRFFGMDTMMHPASHNCCNHSIEEWAPVSST